MGTNGQPKRPYLGDVMNEMGALVPSYGRQTLALAMIRCYNRHMRQRLGETPRFAYCFCRRKGLRNLVGLKARTACVMPGEPRA